MFRGPLSVNSRGVGFLSPQKEAAGGRACRGKRTPEEDIEIAPEHLNCALHGDEVEVAFAGGKSMRGRRLGKVLRVVSRRRSTLVGVVQKEGNELFVRPDDWRCYTDFRLTKGSQKQAAEGDKVLIAMKPWSNPAHAPEADIAEVIGRAGEHNAEMRAVALARGFSSSFPSSVEREAEETGRREKEILAAEIPKRRDFRDTLTFTIDPADAKDFDDALSFKKLPNGNYEVGVHIADVSFFVREGTALDTEARERGFSVYLVDRTIPMLPEILSNDLCSLNPHEDKFAFSAVWEVDEKMKTHSRWIGRTVIRSARRFTYEEAQEILDAELREERLSSAPSLRSALVVLNRLAKIMDAENRAAGAIDFATDEVKFELDETGRPIRAYKKPHLETHKLIEEWMLFANRAVAEFLGEVREKNGKRPVLYRIHDAPDQEKIAELALFVKALGHHLPLGGAQVTGTDLQQLFKKIAGEAEEALIKTTALRSMAKAIYSTKNIGHFGLAMPFYTHFTSPIRRYADLLVHRMLALHLHGEKMKETEWAEYEKLADHITEREIGAAEAERESVKMKQVEYMAERIGQSFEGTISGVTEWGVYIEEKETKAEGMASLRNFTDDFYSLDEKHYCIVGSRTGKKYSLGDAVRFKIMGADRERKTLDMQIL